MIKRFLILFLLNFMIALPTWAESYQIEDISVLGLKRVSPSIVFSAMKVEANTLVDDEDLQQLIRDLFDTGYFSDVKVGIDDSVLVVQLTERPVISMILFQGNDEIPTDALIEGLKSIGLAEGDIFKESALESISKQLNAQYSALGRYAAQIDTYVRNTEQNQVSLGIRINEGQVAKIKHINVVGNTVFTEERLQDLFSLHVTGTWSWLSGSDKYAREKLAGDLERLKSFYLNRGYLKFAVTSTQVSLSPDKETVFITVNVDEGKPYKISEVKIAGDPILKEEEITSLIEIKAGELFSQLAITESEQNIVSRLGDEGYSSARVGGTPEVDDEALTAKLTFFIDPGSISYVRRIYFRGNTSTSDRVLRREMRQVEGAPISAEKLRLSKRRLERLGLFGKVDVQTYEVPGTTDQLDVEITVTEQPTASINFSVGYSGSSGVSYGAGLQHNNWLGSGNTFGFNIEQSETENKYSLNFKNPYYTKQGVSRGVSLFYRERDFDEISVSNYATDSYGLKVNFGYPISETGRISFGLGYENIRVEAGTSTAQEIKGTPDFRSGIDSSIDYNYYQSILSVLTDSNNNGFSDEKDNISDSDLLTVTGDGSDYLIVDESNSDLSPDGFLDQYGTRFDAYSLNFGWSNSTHNRGIFPTKGLSQNLSFEVAVPGGDLEYYKMIYRSDLYFPLGEKSAFRIKGRMGYASGYGDTETLPFFENFFAGGIGSVRGFRSRSLGPKGTPAESLIAVPADVGNNGDIDYFYVRNADGSLVTYADNDLNTIGGDTLFELSTELVFPMPFASSKDNVRTSVFVDSGNVFSTECRETQQQCNEFDFGQLSVAAGVSLQWLSPIAPLSFSFSRPIVEQPYDKSEFFQFSLGTTF